MNPLLRLELPPHHRESICHFPGSHFESTDRVAWQQQTIYFPSVYSFYGQGVEGETTKTMNLTNCS